MAGLIAVIAALNVAVLVALWFLMRYVQGLAQLPVEVRGLSERIATVERGQGAVGQDLHSVSSNLLRELSQARNTLTELQTQARVRAEQDQLVATSVRRLETVIAGTYSKGAAGENMLEALFAQLPAEWQVRDFTVGSKTVEFALRLPNNRLLPIDSKWAATSLLEQMVASDDPIERQRLKRQIESVVLGKAKEVRKYLDPDLTLDFGLAAVPDAVYDICTGIQCECFEQKVVLIAYSMFVPYLLLVFQMVLQTSQNIDMEKLASCLAAAEESAKKIGEELEGRFNRSITMLMNSKEEMKGQLSRINGSLTSVRVGTSALAGDDITQEKLYHDLQEIDTDAHAYSGPQ